MSQDHLIKLKSTDPKSNFVYWTRRKKKAERPEKLKVKKYDPVVKKHVLFEEVKK